MAHKVITIERGSWNGRPVFASRCTEPGCGAITFGGYATRREAREALRGHENGKGSPVAADEPMSQAVAAAENQIHIHTMEQDMTKTIIPDISIDYNLVRDSRLAASARTTARIETILASDSGRAVLTHYALDVLNTAVNDEVVDPNDFVDTVGFTRGQFDYYLGGGGQNALAEHVDAALRAAGADIETALEYAERKDAASQVEAQRLIEQTAQLEAEQGPEEGAEPYVVLVHGGRAEAYWSCTDGVEEIIVDSAVSHMGGEVVVVRIANGVLEFEPDDAERLATLLTSAAIRVRAFGYEVER